MEDESCHSPIGWQGHKLGPSRPFTYLANSRSTVRLFTQPIWALIAFRGTEPGI